MKTFFAIFVLLVVVLAVYPFLDPSEEKETVTGLPWQIEVLPDGSTQVFGVHIGSSRISDIIETLGNDMELAIVAASNEAGIIEIYYGHYRAGLLSGKLVLQTSTAEEKIKKWRDSAVKSEYMATGEARKYYFSEHDLPQVLSEVVTGLTFIPAVNLDEEVVLARFGEPHARIQKTGMTHYLYPDKGLDVVLYNDAKDVMQYVSPVAFQQLRQPLE